ncbi:MAG: hypothetical protein ABIT05_12685 [Chitinophagaceae bacterium]
MYSFRKNRQVRVWIFLAICLITQQRSAAQEQVAGMWSGTITMQSHWSGMTGTREVKISLSISDNIVSGTVEVHEKAILGGIHMADTDCMGSGKGQLEKVQFEASGHYSISVFPPGMHCITTSFLGAPTEENDGKLQEVTVTSEPTPKNRNILSGSKTEKIESPPELGEGTVTTVWNLQAKTNVELIVNPDNYDNWLPEAGKDELTKGALMKVNLKLKSTDGKPLALKAKSFELTLSNTSMEPGITINYPISPATDQLPDLRFVKADIAESNKADQSLTIPCTDGSTGKASIASYDGGGWSTLSVVALMEDSTRIRGHLLVSQGDIDICIPKRDPAAKIATSWLQAHGNPGETDDNDHSLGNLNDGDGLSAYEEYRGVIAMVKENGVFKEKFQRLDPEKKELGIWMKKKVMPIFLEGFGILENAAGIKVISLIDNEMGADRMFNRNNKSANIYKQYVEKLDTGSLGGIAVGENRPSTDKPKIPKQSESVVIDTAMLTSAYATQAAALRNTHLRMPYTLKEDIANTVAHELAHGIGLVHHGPPTLGIPNITIPQNSKDYHVYDTYGHDITRPGVEINGLIGRPGNDESGDTSCIMAYTHYYQWVHKADKGTLDYYAIPLLPVGKTFCTSLVGTGLNKNNNYFGDATAGKCIEAIKFK